MAQLYFYYSAMNAGKSTSLLQSSYNYLERGMKTVIFTAQLDDRFGQGKVTSRIGLSSDARQFSKDSNLYQEINQLLAAETIDCILIDESQFLSEEQVKQLTDVVDYLSIPVLAYGIRTDFLGQTFSGSAALMAWADKLIELKTVCHCGRKANFIIRFNEQGKPVTSGSQVQIGGNDMYESVCRKHFKAAVWDKS
ncbi:thymidine kinase [Thalassotalea sp. Y01]|uniref:thymidine kinase n=1 Tax=Thalassotalea sp. Y01 TaxID=2729613 RepID=UPI00145D6B75|nr:thymidine kinase [Thalassotalea sp. Y01]NMP15434.1 thymidine kinase [Thalassotalea sp. Y01]